MGQSISLSLSGFLFEDDYRTQSLSFADFAVLAREAGYEGVELRKTQVNLDTAADVVTRYRSILDDNGLCVTCMTPRGLPVEIQERNELFGRYLDLAGRLGCELLKVNGDPQWLHQAARRAAEHGIALATNTHINSATETVGGTRALLEEVDHPNFGLLYDPMHLAIAGEDYLGAIEPFFSRIHNVLVQCVRPAAAGETPAIHHAGRDYVKTFMDESPIQDWPAVFTKLKQLRYNGWITVIENSWPQSRRKEVAVRAADHICNAWHRLS